MSVSEPQENPLKPAFFRGLDIYPQACYLLRESLSNEI